MDDRTNRKRQDDVRGNLNDKVCRGAKRTIVVGLSRWMGMDYLDESAHQYQPNAHDSQQF